MTDLFSKTLSVISCPDASCKSSSSARSPVLERVRLLDILWPADPERGEVRRDDVQKTSTLREGEGVHRAR